VTDLTARRGTPAPRLQGFTPARLVELGQRAWPEVGLTLEEARRIIAHVTQRGSDVALGTRNVRASVRDAVFERVGVGKLTLVERRASSVDPFVKYVFELEDGARIETVRIPLHKPGRFSVCVSSQVGCALGCTFCATGTMGLVRHLAAWEIVEQVRAVAKELRAEGLGRVHGVVFQGMGEPLHNVDNVLDALDVIADPCGIAVDARQVTVCTAGIVPGIVEMTRRGTRARLAISVTSARESVRRSLMPIDKRYPLREVIEAARGFYDRSGRLVMFSFALMAGVNTSPEDARALAEALGVGTDRALPVRISLVEHNAFDGSPYARPSDEEFAAFVDALSRLGVPVVRRYSGGGDIGAACGQLVTERDRSSSRASLSEGPRPSTTR
jgi:23S rRNA (adenine2503-C2)-methyltransferase